ncbi:methyl-accepting chemotaxis protein [Paludicola sp. MB14-C6]|uniref:methyl-accepting chemotaxis protein n=1 Tax=Paludihabitans sp. MB14-C6 TaxID=3070656 RepID=UPI0027DCE979|nr:methyl-accepting chemotaxis protein [Paludicola sp. MB14-C6]WMJ21907.1 methyl-accepting chemotaxis protein [Paludicola sp. MB14-C6]
MKKFNVHSLGFKMLTYTISLLVLSMLVVTAVSNIYSYNSTMKLSKDSMSELAKSATAKIGEEIKGLTNLVSNAANESETSSDNAEKEVIDYLNQLAARDGFDYMRRTNKEGISYESGSNVTDRDYYIACKSTGKPFVSDPLKAKDTGKSYVMISAPILKNNVFDGVLYGAISLKYFSEAVSEISIGKTGGAYIIDKLGTTIADADYSVVENEENSQAAAKTDKSLVKLATLEKKMTEGQTGFGEYTYKSNEKLMAFTPIKGSNGWSLGVTLNKNEFFQSTYNAIIFCVILSAVMILVVAFIFSRYAKNITKAVVEIEKASFKMADGDLNVHANVKRKDELGRLANSFNETIDKLRNYINDIANTSQTIANGNFNIEFKQQFAGDFVVIQTAITNLSRSLSNTLGQVKEAASQVESGGSQVSSGAQALSQGATEQASSIQELSASINEISNQVKQTAVNANQANTAVGTVAAEMLTSNDQMSELMNAMQNINQAAREISKIIKAIDDIAFQTNILALNAAVEAARAGAAGKGFAVVAEEVRNLATKSAEAAKTTTNLIEESVDAVENGLTLATKTAQSMQNVVEGANSITALIGEISDAANSQATSISQVTQGVEQISGVVQTNSATAEESAAASEELSSQAQLLNELVSQFVLISNEYRVVEEVLNPTPQSNVEPIITYANNNLGSKY